MKKPFILLGAFATASITSFAQTTWTSTSSTIYTTVTNWSSGLPSTGPQLAIFGDSATVQHTIDIQGTTARNAVGLQFTAFGGGAGFTFGSSTSNSPGFQNRTANIAGTGASILNSDENTQTFNVPVWMFSATGVTGATAAQTWLSQGGPMIFSGILAPSGRNTVNNNGGLLTIDGAFDTTIGITGASFGDIIGAGGLTKNGAGTLTLGGGLPNVYTGPTILNNGQLIANKINALGNGSALTINGGTMGIGFSQSVAAVTVAAGSMIGNAPLTGTSYTFQSGTIDEELSGNGGLTKTTAGTGILGGTFGNPCSYLGTTRIDAGILQLGANDRLPDPSNMLLNGGTFSTAGFSDSLGALDLDISSTIDFGSGNSALAFADSDARDWNGATLSITNWTAGSDTFRIGTDGTGFGTQLALIRFTDLGNAPAQIDANGFITPQVAPEPSSVALALVGMVGLAARRRRSAV